MKHIQQISVVGAGVMGHGLAQTFAQAGYDVILHSRTEKSLDNAIEAIKENLHRLALINGSDPKDASKVLRQIRKTTHLKDAAKTADVVLEAVYEDIPTKKKIFDDLDKSTPDDALLLSTTSSLPISLFGDQIEKNNRVMVAHFANPPYLVPTVELVRGSGTSDDTVDTVVKWLNQIGKRPLLLEKEVPGFIINRLQFALLREALYMVEEGIASAADIDTALKTSIGRRWSVAGVFEVFDVAGWDVIADIMKGLVPHLSSSVEVPDILKDKIEEGLLGVKTGQGFYNWTPEEAENIRLRIAHALVEIEKWK